MTSRSPFAPNAYVVWLHPARYRARVAIARNDADMEEVARKHQGNEIAEAIGRRIPRHVQLCPGAPPAVSLNQVNVDLGNEVTFANQSLGCFRAHVRLFSHVWFSQTPIAAGRGRHIMPSTGISILALGMRPVYSQSPSAASPVEEAAIVRADRTQTCHWPLCSHVPNPPASSDQYRLKQFSLKLAGVWKFDREDDEEDDKRQSGYDRNNLLPVFCLLLCQRYPKQIHLEMLFIQLYRDFALSGLVPNVPRRPSRTIMVLAPL